MLRCKIWLLLILIPLIGVAEPLDSSKLLTDTIASISNDTIANDTSSKKEAIAIDDAELPISRSRTNRWWVFLYAIFVLIAIGLLKNINPGRHIISVASYWSSPKTENEMVEDNFGVDAFLISEVVLSFLILGWLVMQFNPFDLNITLLSEFTIFMLCILGVALIYVFKFFVHYIVGLVLQTDRLSKLMVYSQANMLYSLCLILFPCLLVYYYARNDSIQYVMSIAIASFLFLHVLLRWLKSFRIYFEFFPYSKLYIFIYLCALEIIPLLVLVQILYFRA